MHPHFPRPPLAIVIVTQLLLGGLFVIGLMAILLLPVASEKAACGLPEYAGLRVPLLSLAIAFVSLALLTIAMIALLIARVRRGTILTRVSILWVDIVIACLIAGAAVMIASVAVILAAQAGTPLLGVIQIPAILALAALAGVSLVLRSLLRHAISLRAELDEVV